MKITNIYFEFDEVKLNFFSYKYIDDNSFNEEMNMNYSFLDKAQRFSLSFSYVQE